MPCFIPKEGIAIDRGNKDAVAFFFFGCLSVRNTDVIALGSDQVFELPDLTLGCHVLKLR